MRSCLLKARTALALGCTLLALLATAGGCNRPAKTPEEAWKRFTAAVKERDARALYHALDLPTRWSWMTVRRSQREAHDIVLSNFPEGPVRDQQLRRFEAAALAQSEADLFASWLPADRWNELGRDLPEGSAPTSEGADSARVAGKPGQSWSLRRGDDGAWGFAGLAEEAEQVKRRALADLEQARNNAADLERAATRAGK